MSGFAYKLKMSTAIVPVAYAIMPEESAGKIGKWIGVIAAVIIPFAAPAIFGALATSGFLGTAIGAAAASGGLVGIATNVIGAAAIGGLLNAGAALASGANIGQAFAQGALSGGLGGLGRGLGLSGAPGGAAKAGGLPVAGVKGPMALAPTAGSIGTGAIGATPAGSAITASTGAGINAVGAAASGTMSQQMGQAISTRFAGTSGIDLNRIGAAILNAAVNGENVAGAEDLVAQQRAELAQLAATNRTVYEQRIRAAQDILSDASRMDPDWIGRIRMADVAGVEANQFRQAMRNIATRQGGSLDTGQRKAYERGAALHTARSKALAFGRGFTEATGVRAQMQGSAAGLMTPDQHGLAIQQADSGLAEGLFSEQAATRANTAGVWGEAIFGPNYGNPSSTSPVGQQQQDDDEQTPWGGFGPPRG